ncbi:unnamed protein product, partial [Owenia fusiformis]
GDSAMETINTDGDTTIVHIGDLMEESKSSFSKRNIMSLQQLGGPEILLEVCNRLAFLQRYIQRYKESVAENTFIMPSTHADAMGLKASFQSVLNDVSLVWRVFSLPVLEPLT